MRLRAVAVALPLLLLAACGSGTTTTPTTGTSGTGASSSVSASPGPTLGPEVAPATAVAAPVPAAQMPTASGKFGEKPTLTFPATDPPPSLQRVILSEGDGPEIQDQDWLITNYLGQIWKGEVFDNSYDRKATSAFQLGKVVPGWNVGLLGVKVGSRVMLSLPPQDGYGINGNPGAGIGGQDTLVFVIDVVDAIGKNQGGQSDAKLQTLPAGLPKVTGALGKPPTIVIGTAKAPTAPTLNVVALGTGPKVTAAGSVLVQLEAVGFDGAPQGTTWPESKNADPQTGSGSGPQQIPLGAQGAFAGMTGVPVGSRVLVTLPASTGSSGEAQPAAALVVDVLAQTSTTAS